MSSISDEIYSNIKNQIIVGKLNPGDKLPTENEMCKIWNTSRVSVREAMERLVALGILRKVRGGGTYVNQPDPSIFLDPLLPFVIFREEKIIDILKFRSIIEIGSAKLCAENRDEENLRNLRSYLDVMEKNIGRSSEFVEADLEFHMEIARGSKNPINVKINEMLRHIMRKHQMTLNNILGISTSIKEHKNIYIAIEERNSKLAEHFIEKHILRAISDMGRLDY
ncbi:transcriptional regulator, GntR family [Anaerovirgula multivorans]|uniref:Transcriptional regulator, GntR family n=1 Tax=Anaerovirgula multivorans TaxID=312168 RepID=A0A239GY73_9FIRM|nr:FadR/GntR family transcriptional regulator [Anaerovirgula multivorans]SNS73871.1 transcriptional regulator, GntR family [Anaerovirgula multivorans]